MKLSERLSQLREKKGLNQKEAAVALNIQYATYNKYETGSSKPTYETLIEIARFYGCTTDYLLGVSSAASPDHADIAARTGLRGEAIKCLEEMHSDALQGYRPIIRAINDLIIHTETDQDVLSWIAAYLRYDFAGHPFRSAKTGDSVQYLNLAYNDDGDIFVKPVSLDARDVIGAKIMTVLRDLSNKIREDASK